MTCECVSLLTNTAHIQIGGWARTHRTQYAQSIFSDLCLILGCCFKSCFNYNMPTRFEFLLQVWLPPTTPRGKQWLQACFIWVIDDLKASRLGSPLNHVQKIIMSSDLMSWQLWHISTEATHLVSFFWDMLQSLTEVYLLVYCLQSSATHCETMMSHTPAGVKKVIIFFEPYNNRGQVHWREVACVFVT